MLHWYHDRFPTELDPPDRELNLFVRESNAYCCLKAKRFCKRGVTPNFYGTITKIQLAEWLDLHMFLEDKLPPNAILIEYIPNMKMVNLSNYSKQTLDTLFAILWGMHQARVLHEDSIPRNMMVCENLKRLLWFDFDSAQMFPEYGSLSQRHETWFAEEVETVEYFVDNMVCYRQCDDCRLLAGFCRPRITRWVN